MWFLQARIARQARTGALLGVALCSACQGSEPQQDPALSAKRQVPSEKKSPAAPERPRRSADAITYTVARGGTLLEIANLYKLEHHEIIDLNPGINPEAQLAPQTEVVVFDAFGRNGQSIGLPHDGRLQDAAPMPNGPGRKITAERWKTWGSSHTVRQMDRVLRRWADEHPEWPAVLVGNLSARRGGELSPHKSHQSGRDIDLSYIAKGPGGSLQWQKMNASNLDCEKTWALLKTIISHAEVEVIYIDRKLQRLLLRSALRTGQVRREQLRAWLEVAPGARRGSTLIRHATNHEDHFHVRLACAQGESRCRS